MAKSNDIPSGVIGLLVAIIVFLLGVFGLLFAPSAPTSSSSKGTVIPLENASLSEPSQIQGNVSTNPQNAATVQPGGLENALR